MLADGGSRITNQRKIDQRIAAESPPKRRIIGTPTQPPTHSRSAAEPSTDRASRARSIEPSRHSGFRS